MWIDMVPAIVRTAPEPTPTFPWPQSALPKFGMSGQSQIVVGRKVDDFMAVEARDRKLLRFPEYATFEKALFAQLLSSS